MIITVDKREYPSIIEALEEENIFSIEKRKGLYVIEEVVAFAFQLAPTKEQLLGLSEELRAMALKE